MNENRELYKLLKFILDIDISFIIKDILGSNFEDIEIPSNIDEEECTLEVNTPHGVFTIHIINNEDKKEVKFMHYIGENYYEEYRLDLYPEDKWCYHLDGKTVEFREKGYIINNIDKDYIYDSENNKISNLAEIIRLMEVYPMRELAQMDRYGNFPMDSYSHERIVLLPILGHIGDDYEVSFHNRVFENQIFISIKHPDDSLKTLTHPRLTINGYDKPCYMVTGNNVVGKIYDLLEGIITKDNYEDAISFANKGEFNRYFAYYDSHSKEGVKSINEWIDEIIGKGLSNYRREYSIYLRKVIDEYYNYIKNNPFLFDEHITSLTDKKRELEKNNYIKEILLRNKEN